MNRYVIDTMRQWQAMAGGPQSTGTNRTVKFGTWMAWGLFLALVFGLMAMLYGYDSNPRRFNGTRAIIWFVVWFNVGALITALIYKVHKKSTELAEAMEAAVYYYNRCMEIAERNGNSFASTTHTHTYKDATGRIIDRHDLVPDEDKELSEEEYMARFGTMRPGEKHQREQQAMRDEITRQMREEAELAKQTATAEQKARTFAGYILPWQTNGPSSTARGRKQINAKSGRGLW